MLCATLQPRGVHFGRPNVTLPIAQVEKFRAQGLSWPKIQAETKIAEDTLLGGAANLVSLTRKSYAGPLEVGEAPITVRASYNGLWRVNQFAKDLFGRIS